MTTALQTLLDNTDQRIRNKVHEANALRAKLGSVEAQVLVLNDVRDEIQTAISKAGKSA